MNFRSYLNRHEVHPAIIKAIAHVESEKAKGNLSEMQAKKMFVDLQYEMLKQVVVTSTDAHKSRNAIAGASAESANNKPE